MRQRVLLASNRGPFSYWFGAEGTLGIVTLLSISFSKNRPWHGWAMIIGEQQLLRQAQKPRTN
jgi:hypothetical protein